MHEIEKFFEAYESATNNEFERLDKLYSEFYKNFPGTKVLGDVILKKQGRIDFSTNQTDTTLGYKITDAVNAWYSPQIKLLGKSKNISAPKVNYSNSVEVLYISGEYDVASPAEYLYDTAYFNYTNNQKLVIPKAGHLDLFDSKSNQIKDAVLVFFK
jgi:pimeloyl-ACP methyl ester carboxylesterase